MIEVGLLYPWADEGVLIFSLLPSFMFERNEVEQSKTFEFTWLFWGFHITIYYDADAMSP